MESRNMVLGNIFSEQEERLRHKALIDTAGTREGGMN